MRKAQVLFLMLTVTVYSGCVSIVYNEPMEQSTPKVEVDVVELDDSARIAELDDYWAEVSRCVKEGDFEGYTATFHKDAVLVSGFSEKAYPISQALEGWKSNILETQSGKNQASVEFKFSRRLGDSTTAHETGIFHYAMIDAEGTKTEYYVQFEALLVKRGKWIAMMENQQSDATEEDWNALK